MPFCYSYKSILSLHQSDLTSETTGTNSDYPTYVAIKGTVFDVTGNKAYGPEGSYKGMSEHDVRLSPLFLQTNNDCLRQVFAGKDASRALGQSSLKPEECRPDWSDLSDEHKKVLNDWFTFFSKRYNIKGKVEGATNT